METQEGGEREIVRKLKEGEGGIWSETWGRGAGGVEENSLRKSEIGGTHTKSKKSHGMGVTEGDTVLDERTVSLVKEFLPLKTVKGKGDEQKGTARLYNKMKGIIKGETTQNHSRKQVSERECPQNWGKKKRKVVDLVLGRREVIGHI